MLKQVRLGVVAMQFPGCVCTRNFGGHSTRMYV